MPAPIGAAAAAAAYRAPTAAPVTGADGFGATLRRAMEGAVNAGREADAQSRSALLGGGDVTRTVLAVSQAETALQTAVAIRDRVVAAYQDVMRMPI